MNRVRERRAARDWSQAELADRVGISRTLVSAIEAEPVRTEGYDVCFTAKHSHDPRAQALMRVIQSSDYRRLLGELPGYDISQTGQLQVVSGNTT